MLVFKGIVYSILFLLELGALAAFSYWGFKVDASKIVKLLLGIGTPIAVAIFWGAFIAPKAQFHLSRLLLILLKIIVFGLAAAALYVSEQRTFAFAFAVVVIVELLLVHGVFERA